MNINYAKSLVIKAGIDLVESGLIARTWGNVSCRIDENSFVITPSGRDYRTLTQDEIVQVNISDLRYEGNIKPSSEKGMHAEVYKLYPHINFVIHTHQSNASVIAASEVNSVKLNSRYPLLNGEVICAKYGLPGTKLLRKNVVEALMNSETHAVIMKYHGALCFGKDYDETFMAASDLEKACSEFIINQYLKLSGKNEYNDIDMYKFALSLNSVSHKNDFTIYDNRKEMEVKRDSLTEICLPKEEAEIYKCIFRSNKDINYILFENSPEIQAVSQSNVKINPILDDFAQIAGSYTKNADKNPIQVTKALKKSPVVFIRGLGALFCGKTYDDAEAVKLVTRKQCKAFLGASLFGNVKPIKPLECRLMRFVYLNKYSKMVSKK